MDYNSYMHDIASNCKIFGYFAGSTAMFDRLMISNNILIIVLEDMNYT